MIKVNDDLIDFSLYDESGNLVRLSELKNKYIIVYFYSKDNTSGCTNQALEYRNLYSEFQKYDVKIIGISKDTVKSHCSFRQKHDIPFTLLADEANDVINKYDVFKEKNMYGKKVMGVLRSSFIIKDGKFVKVSYNVKPLEDAKNNLEFIKNN